MNVEAHETEEARVRAAEHLNSIRSDLKRLRADLEKLARTGRPRELRDLGEMKARLRQQAADLEERTTQRLRRAYLLAREQGRQTLERSRAAVDATRNRVVTRPLTSMLVSMGVGMLLGRLVRRR